MAVLAVSGVALGQAPAPSGQSQEVVPHTTNGTHQAPVNGSYIVPHEASLAEAPMVEFEESRFVPYRVWAGAEYLLWRLRNAPMPPNNVVIPYSLTGMTDFSNTVLYPEGGSMSYGGRNGIRVNAGMWLDPDQNIGVDFNYFQLEQRSAGFVNNQISNTPLDVTVTVIPQFSGDGSIFNFADFPTIDITVPAELTVTSSGTVTPIRFWGAEANLCSKRLFYGNANFDVFLGFRFLDLEEAFTMNQNMRLDVFQQLNYVATSVPPTPANPTGLVLPQIPSTTFQDGAQTIVLIQTTDAINTRNQFYGGQAGVAFEWLMRERLSFSGYGKVGIGTMNQSTTLTGATSVSSVASTTGSNRDLNLGPVNLPGGVFTPNASPVIDSRSKYVVIPEFNLTLGYQLTRAIRASVGYNFLWISSVVRPGDQIAYVRNQTELSVTGTAVPVLTAQPAYRYQDATFWAQGINFGLEFRY